MTFRLVRAEPSEGMLAAACKEPYSKGDARPTGPLWLWLAVRGLDVSIFVPAYRGMLSASESLTDAEIDELCRAMWPDKYLWRQPPMQGAMADHDRNDDRTRMRAFIASLEGRQK